MLLGFGERYGLPESVGKIRIGGFEPRAKFVAEHVCHKVDDVSACGVTTYQIVGFGGELYEEVPRALPSGFQADVRELAQGLADGPCSSPPRSVDPSRWT
ncbi:hypothetical protein [Micromonospora sp. S-DT3-3-22]|uniref:hypothetical protein n=1 Tax=Micromonospora sp. S-DT3-3-22 TaxID=2755359 RepID=UPI00188F4886|nr:hypothetical protein [Micromonospora sp. S-DT3-3-22]